MQIPVRDFRARAGKQAVGKRGVDIIRATGTRGLLVINFNRISARAIVTSLSMADINRARVSLPSVILSPLSRRYRVYDDDKHVTHRSVVQTVATTIRLAGTIAHLFDNL